MAHLKENETQPRKGFFARWLESMAEARMRRAEVELGYHPPEAADDDDADSARAPEPRRH